MFTLLAQIDFSQAVSYFTQLDVRLKLLGLFSAITVLRSWRSKHDVFKTVLIFPASSFYITQQNFSGKSFSVGLTDTISDKSNNSSTGFPNGCSAILPHKLPSAISSSHHRATTDLLSAAEFDNYDQQPWSPMPCANHRPNPNSWIPVQSFECTESDPRRTPTSGFKISRSQLPGLRFFPSAAVVWANFCYCWWVTFGQDPNDLSPSTVVSLEHETREYGIKRMSKSELLLFTTIISNVQQTDTFVLCRSFPEFGTLFFNLTHKRYFNCSKTGKSKRSIIMSYVIISAN